MNDTITLKGIEIPIDNIAYVHIEYPSKGGLKREGINVDENGKITEEDSAYLEGKMAHPPARITIGRKDNGGFEIAGFIPDLEYQANMQKEPWSHLPFSKFEETVRGIHSKIKNYYDIQNRQNDDFQSRADAHVEREINRAKLGRLRRPKV